ncbi:MAG TPA: hypothetical protein VGO11_22745 [Chthoniobacteraceae bacterium]|jgi:hypothetical protein|nr:hypothetical protein [Chthoniobacteraceae bacterium]
MKLERAQEYLTTFIAIAVGMLAAYYVGNLSGHGHFGRIGAMVLGVGFFALLLALREQIWLLIPFSLPFVGQLTEITGHPAIKDVAVCAVFGGVFALRAFKVIRRKPKYDALDFWGGLMLLYLLTVYVRNPVGGDALGSARVGGRPYLNTSVAMLAYWALARVAMPVQIARRCFIALASLSCLTNLLTIVQVHFPITTPAISQLLGGANGQEGGDAGGGGEGVNLATGGEGGRLFYLGGFGSALATALIAAFPPLSLLNPLRIIRHLLWGVALSCILAAGYRGILFEIAVVFSITTYLRGDLVKLLKLMGIASIGLVLLLLMQGTIINLPTSLQRSISFLPGKWDPNVLLDTQFSSQWRFDMWERMLKTDRYIENKWLGDGFGLTAMQLQQAQTALANNSPEQIKESFLISGMVHSGPVSTIRYVGYVGLFIFMMFLIVCAREAWLICRACKGTPYFALSLLIGVPIIFRPIGFVVIFGAYDSDLPSALIAAGLLKMLRTSIREHLETRQAPEPALSPNFGAVPAGRPLPAHLRF